MTGITRLADVQAIEADAPTLPASTHELIARAAAAHASAPALSFFARVQDHDRPLTWDYATLLARINATANYFHTLDIGPADVVAFVLPNLPQTHLTIWGGQAAGIVFAINPLLEPPAIIELLRAGEAKVLVMLAPPPEDAAAPGTGAPDLWSTLRHRIAELPALRHVVLVDPAHALDDALGSTPAAAPLAVATPQAVASPQPIASLGTGSARIAVHDFAAGLRVQPADRLVSGRHIAPDELSSYYCTGGTTGLPKIAMRTHRNEVANAWSAAQVFGAGIGPGKTLFCGLPMFHVNAVLVTGLLPFSRGAHVLLGTPQGFRGDGVIARFWEIVDRHRINFFSGVPTLYAALLQQPIGDHDLSSLEFGLCGAAPMPPELMRRFQDSTGLKILEGYGLTEGTCVSTVNPPAGQRRHGSIGLRIPLQPMKAVLLDEAGAWQRDCAVDEVGVLAIRGPNVFAGYKLAEQNAGLWIVDGDGERWLNTGDLGRQDADGYFHLTGRKKELIIRGGHNIDPAVIEQPLHQHPAVQLAAAVGRPDAHAGEVPVAYVQLKPGASADEAALLDFARKRIGERAAVPKAIRIVPALPLTAVGKIFKPALKQREVEDALADALHGAGVAVAALRARSDARRGLVVEATLGPGADEAFARRVLGQFPIAVELSAGPAGADVRAAGGSPLPDGAGAAPGTVPGARSFSPG
jgi:fatty-acyl-CoA synthase